MERAAVYLTAPRPLTVGTPRRAPQGGLPAQNRCCCRGAFLFSALTSEACRARLSSLACQAGTHICFPCFLAICSHMAPALQGGPGSSCCPSRLVGHLSMAMGQMGELRGLPRWADWHLLPGSRWEGTGLSAFLKLQPPSPGGVGALLDGWEPSAPRTELSRLALSQTWR